MRRCAEEDGAGIDVLVGAEGRVLSGTALTTARRVKEAARQAEILLGPAATAQSAGAAWTEPSEGGHRLTELVEGAPPIPRRPDAPLVGRRAELEKLVVAARESAAASVCRRVVVLGEPGIGKTRLAAELVRTIGGEARVLTGRCVPYAQGATYLPLAEIVEQITAGQEFGLALHAVLDGEPDGEHVATRLVDALSGAAAVDSGDVFWATRKLLETVAREQSLLVVLEDVHWAEPTFLDLVEYLVGWSTGAPIALVCLARPELVDTRPAWAADTVVLRPLGDTETAEFLDALPESLALDAGGRAAVVAAAEGNPLFLEQLAAHALDGPVDAGRVPGSLESLLASRLDSLDPGERDVLERAAVVGREFTRAAVDALSADEWHGSATALLALVRRRLVRPDAVRGSGDAFLFDHALIRDATYAAVAKSERARLHEQLARWLERRDEPDEIVGYHLEQAVLCRLEVGVSTDHLAEEASERLARAGGQAAWARDNRAAVSLLTRASALLPRTDPRRLELECELSVPLKNLWESRRAFELLDDVAARAVESGNRRLELRARVEQVWPRLISGDVDLEGVLSITQACIRACEDEGDLMGLARTWLLVLTVERRLRGRFDAAVEAGRRAAEYFARYGTPGLADSLLADTIVDGATPVDEAIAFCESLVEPSRPRSHEAFVALELAWLRSWKGDLVQARALVDHAHALYREIGDSVAIMSVVSLCRANISLLEGDAESAAEVAHAGLAEATRRNDGIWRTQFLGPLARAALIEGDHGTALALTADALRTATHGDPYHEVTWRSPRACALAVAGQGDAAEMLARETVEIVDTTDCLYAQGEARVALAEVLAATGRPDAAVATADEATALFGRKGATLLAERVRAQVERYRRGEPGQQAPLTRA